MVFMKDFVWLAGVVAAVLLWIMTSIKSSAEDVEKSVKMYVDEKHDGVKEELRSQREILLRVDDRVYKLVHEKKL